MRTASRWPPFGNSIAALAPTLALAGRSGSALRRQSSSSSGSLRGDRPDPRAGAAAPADQAVMDTLASLRRLGRNTDGGATPPAACRTASHFGLCLLAGCVVATCAGDSSEDAPANERASGAATQGPTVTVSPIRGRQRTIFVFEGRGWLPTKWMRASYGSSAEGGICPDVLLVTRFRTDVQGRFRFRMRTGRRPPDGPRPKAAGSGSVSFRQPAPGATAGRGGSITRRPRYVVKGDPCFLP